ncbi:MAG: 50S ribosomal protein L10 [Desulfobacterales bacterium]|nr:50S ribosomal protein L10 [Desulfobacterales bacterium]MDP6808899.1 50S ribosomal protein L10 [Desulfobacterales bacterium]
MKTSEKKKIIEDLHEKLLRAKVVILSDYKGLDVSSINNLRRNLRAVGIEYQVVKNTLLIRASEDTDAALIKETFKGPNAVALSFDDPVAPAKVLIKFAEENKNLEIKKGVMDGKVLDLNRIQMLSVLPSRELLLRQVLSVMNGVPTALVRALSNVLERFLIVLQAIKEQKEDA